jgi:hypothetical protein
MRMIVTRANGETQLVTEVLAYLVVNGFRYVVCTTVCERYCEGHWHKESRHAIVPISMLGTVA